MVTLNMGLILVLVTVLYRGLGGEEETHKGFKAGFRKLI